MKQVAISIQNLSKKYKIGKKQDYLTLRDQFSKLGKYVMSFGKNSKKKSEFWALDDVSLEIEKGEVVGIVGRNGAGKSTLLKIISRITPPTKGRIELHGRVASLLEVGTGFSPELTGRENIFLNGSILGMSRKEIRAKFNDIVEFSEIGDFLDTQVKHYSSGMYVRLAFAVAAHLDPDILIVDEVLAVGDAEFQKKCLNKISSISKGEGRTVLFVSHNMSSVTRLCDKAILLENGRVRAVDNPNVIVDKYLNDAKNQKSKYIFKDDIDHPVSINTIKILDQNKKMTSYVNFSQEFYISVDFKVAKKLNAASLVLVVRYQDEIVFVSTECDTSEKLRSYAKGKYNSVVKIPGYLLNVGHFTIGMAVSRPGISLFSKQRVIPIEVRPYQNFKSAILGDSILGLVSPVLSFDTQKSAG